jgi:Bacteriophage head to tail connecting protein
LLNKVIDRAFAMASRAGLLPEPPPELAGQTLKVEYISVLAQAQRAIGIGGIERLTGYVASLAQVKPDILDKVDLDQAVDEYAEMLGTPPSIVLSDEVVGKRRNARAEMQAAAAKMEQTQMAADTAATLGNTPMADGQTALDKLVNPM